MAAKPLTTEAIALTEKKMDMTLGLLNRTSLKAPLISHLLSDISNIHHLLILIDDIIKMAKNKNTKGSKQKRVPVRTCSGNCFPFFCHLVCAVTFMVVTISLYSYTYTEQKPKVFKQIYARQIFKGAELYGFKIFS